MRIGIFGGSFNPIHIGHLILAQECWDKFRLDKVIFVPAYMPPHKELQGKVSAADRLNMVRIALEGDDRFEISTYEIDQAAVSYSIDTIKYLKGKYEKNDTFFFLTGADSAENLSKWKDIDKILELTTFIIATRPGWNEDNAYEDSVKYATIPLVEISSTMIRDRIKKRKPIDFLIPCKVVQYIRDKGLYRG
ncbi:MAG: nicotinate-nucleotide adenylyltransferase [Candidatus Omnitrophica bacterium]|nr:nicotinate-nucleotide adenylyltransferase [Candidatus Omnitrophota bacterium]